MEKNKAITKSLQRMESTKYPLSGGYYTIERVSQEAPCTGDNVIVKGVIFLPPNDESRFTDLSDKLQFGNRVKVLGYCTYSQWGMWEEGSKYRYNTFHASAANWKDAFGIAKEIAERELAKLETALENRASALLSAEL